jgi:hypothetical protein
MTKRRDFLKMGAQVSLASLAGLTSFQQGGTAKVTRGFIAEPAREIKIVRETDVIVCGGGPAGFAAAVASARTGAKTTLVENWGCLGGIWTTGLLSNIIDYRNKPGIMKELVGQLEKSDAQYSAMVYDSELLKISLDQMCKEAGVDIRLYTRIVAAYKGSGNRLENIVTESSSGREAWKAKIFIDTTGNGDLAAQAGCRFDIGHPETGIVQPMSLMAILVGLDEDKMVDGGFMGRRGGCSEDNKRNLWKEIKKSGVEASYAIPSFFGIRPGLIAMMANHQYGVSGIDASQMTKATIEARSEVNRIIDGLRSLGGIWSEVRIAVTGSQIGIREARRIHGLYTITANDLIKGARFEDAVCRVTFNVDVHSLEKKSGGAADNQKVIAQPYDIPIRSLIAKDVNGLMMAGRCISGDFFAHASYRVTGNAVAMGEAAGKVAGQAALNNKLPQEIEYKNQLI